MSRLAVLVALLLLTGATACTPSGSDAYGAHASGASASPGAAPSLGTCRRLTPHDTQIADNSSPAVPCVHPHTAETFAVGTFPNDVAAHGYDSKALGAFVYGHCRDRFASFVGGDESLVMRSLVSWVWFRPTQQAWAKGAHWYRCDIVGGGEQSTTYRRLPTDARAMLNGKPDDHWLSCVNGPSVHGTAKIPCSRPHTWRAVTTIKLGDEKDPYPGDRLVEVRTRDFCSDSVGAWLNYPVDYTFGYTWFHRAEWEAGNRRSVCWARTKQ